jgi:hypothetical protein
VTLCVHQVAVHVAFESKFENHKIITFQLRGLKPGASFKLRVNWIQLTQPHQALKAASVFTCAACSASSFQYPACKRPAMMQK